jgi:hypothetical protein
VVTADVLRNVDVFKWSSHTVDGVANFVYCVHTKDLDQLSDLLSTVKSIPGVFKCVHDVV